MFRNISRGDSAHTVTNIHLTLDERIPIRLQDHVQRLRLILPVLSVSVLALRQQGAELDEDIAAVLSRYGIDPLHVEIETIDALLEMIADAGPGARHAAQEDCDWCPVREETPASHAEEATL